MTIRGTDDARPAALIRVEVPGHLRTLAGIDGTIELPLDGPVTLGAALDALEGAYPALRGTLRGHGGGPRRPYIRFFGGEEDLSFTAYDSALPVAVASGSAPLLIIGSISGG